MLDSPRFTRCLLLGPVRPRKHRHRHPARFPTDTLVYSWQKRPPGGLPPRHSWPWLSASSERPSISWGNRLLIEASIAFTGVAARPGRRLNRLAAGQHDNDPAWLVMPFAVAAPILLAVFLPPSTARLS